MPQHSPASRNLNLIPLRPRGQPQFRLKLRHSPPVPLWLPEGLPRRREQLFKLSDLVVVMTLFLAILACTCSAYTFGQTSTLAARLPAQAYHPTFKRNYLPTLTPTSISPQLPNPQAPPAPVNIPGETAPPAPMDAAVLSASAGPTSPPAAIAEAPPASSGFNLGEFNPGGGGLPLATANIPPFSTAAAEATPTPTSLPVYAPTPASGGSGYALPTLAPGPPPSPATPPPPTPVPTPTPDAGWAFVSVRVYPDQDDGLLLYGNLVNQTGTPQELEDVGGAFYDDQGRVIAGNEGIYANWPVNVVAPGQGVPFELFLNEITHAANFNLNVLAEPSEDAPRQDFEFIDLKQNIEDGDYCVEGAVRNKGGELRDYLVIAAILYDSQDKIVNYSDYEELDPGGVINDQTAEFQICVGPPNQDVARYELRAWGR